MPNRACYLKAVSRLRERADKLPITLQAFLIHQTHSDSVNLQRLAHQIWNDAKAIEKSIRLLGLSHREIMSIRFE